MNAHYLTNLRDWFETYTAPYLADSETGEIIRLKYEHIKRVAEEAAYISSELKLPEHDHLLGQACALLHDIGRFEQIRRFNTLKDSQSVNHAELSVEIIDELNILKGWPIEERDIIRFAVLNHNRLAIEPGVDGSALSHARLVRDADKLDIYRVFEEVQQAGTDEEVQQVFLHVPEKPVVSQTIIDTIKSGSLANHKDLQVRNDFRLLIMSWVYDFNYEPTFRRVRDKHLFKYFISFLPETEEVAGVVDLLNGLLEDGIKRGKAFETDS